MLLKGSCCCSPSACRQPQRAKHLQQARPCPQGPQIQRREKYFKSCRSKSNVTCIDKEMRGAAGRRHFSLVWSKTALRRQGNKKPQGMITHKLHPNIFHVSSAISKTFQVLGASKCQSHDVSPRVLAITQFNLTNFERATVVITIL